MVDPKRVKPKEKKSRQKEESNGVFKLLHGPLRPYVHIDENQLQKWLHMTSSETFQIILVTSLAIFIRVIQVDKPNNMLLQESKMVSIINSYLTGELFVDYNPPLAGLLFTGLSKLFGYNANNLDYISIDEPYINLPFNKLRLFNATLNGLTTLFIYKILRFTGISHFISLFGTYLFTLENSFITQSRLILPDAIYIFFISLFLSQHKIIALKTILSKSAILSTLFASVSLGLALSTHWSGIFLLFYALVSLTYRSWSLSGDLTIPRRLLKLNFIFKHLSYIIISISIYLSLYKVHFDILTNRGNDYNVLSPEFQSTLANNHLFDTVSEIGFGSTVMIRHFKSGGYLHSHDDNYISSGHQQVTLLNTFDDASNFFEVLPIDGFGDDEKIINDAIPISAPFKVKLRHKVTNSSLVIDPNHRPPLSEQEYNFQVTTDNDFEEEDDKKNRYTFQLKISHKYSKSEKSKRYLNSIDSVFQIYNEKSGCYLLGTPLLLSEGFADGQNEVICIKEPNYEASLWYFDWNKNDNFPENKEIVEFDEYTYWDKLYEVLIFNFKRLFIGNHGYDTHSGPSISDWLFLRKGFTHLIDLDDHINIYLLGNQITYYLAILSVSSYLLFKFAQILTTNPHKPQISIPKSYNYDHQTFDCLLAYVIILSLLSVIKIELHLFDCLPVVLMGIIMISQLFQFGSNLYPKTTGILLIISTVLVLLSYIKYAPLIYGFLWTKEKCLKMLVYPGWDQAICDTYKD